MRTIRYAALAVGIAFANAAHAQSGGPPPPANPVSPPAPELRGPDDKMTDFMRMRDDVAGRRAGPTRSRSPVPVSPEDVIVGSEVHDSRGVVIGSIEAVGKGFAVVASKAGKIEVEFESLAKNYKGLLINMPKSKFEAILAGGKQNKQ